MSDPVRRALLNLALAAGAYTRAPGGEARHMLTAAVRDANRVLGGGEPEDGLLDAECLVATWLAFGGPWQDLAAAVNRHALDGVNQDLTRRAG